MIIISALPNMIFQSSIMDCCKPEMYVVYSPCCSSSLQVILASPEYSHGKQQEVLLACPTENAKNSTQTRIHSNARLLL